MAIYFSENQNIKLMCKLNNDELETRNANKNDEVNAHYTNVIMPLNASLDYFVDMLKGSSITLPFSYDITNRVKVGIYSTNQGNTTQIFDDPLDGVEFVSTVTVMKSNNCKC